MELVTVKDEWSSLVKSSSLPSKNEICAVSIHNPAPNVEILDWQFSNEKIRENDSKLCPSAVVCVIEIGSVNWSIEEFHCVEWVPGCKNFDVLLGLFSPSWQVLFKSVL